MADNAQIAFVEPRSVTKNTFSFRPAFNEITPLYKGIVRVWIGEGVEALNDTAGYLYAEFVDGLVQELGFVSDYNSVKQYFSTLGVDFSYEQWIQLLANAPTNARKSEAWAVGTEGNTPVPSTHEAYENNAKHYSEVAENQANSAASSASDASTYATNAGNSATAASGSEALAREAANTARERASEAYNSQTSAGTSATSADTSAKNSEAWAVGKRNNVDVGSEDATYHNNSKYYSEQASNSAATASTQATAAQTAANNAQTYLGTVQGYKTDAQTAATNAQTAAATIDSRMTAIETATQAANTAATGATTATTRANSAATALEGLTATATTLASDATATVNVTTQNNHYVLTFGIPRGANGQQGDASAVSPSFVDGATESGIVFEIA